MRSTSGILGNATTYFVKYFRSIYLSIYSPSQILKSVPFLVLATSSSVVDGLRETTRIKYIKSVSRVFRSSSTGFIFATRKFTSATSTSHRINKWSLRFLAFTLGRTSRRTHKLAPLRENCPENYLSAELPQICRQIHPVIWGFIFFTICHNRFHSQYECNIVFMATSKCCSPGSVTFAAGKYCLKAIYFYTALISDGGQCRFDAFHCLVIYFDRWTCNAMRWLVVLLRFFLNCKWKLKWENDHRISRVSLISLWFNTAPVSTVSNVFFVKLPGSTRPYDQSVGHWPILGNLHTEHKKFYFPKF